MNKTKIISAALAAVMMTGAAAVPASAAVTFADDVQITVSRSTPVEKDRYDDPTERTYKTDDGIIYGIENDGKSCRVIDYAGDSTELIIPREIDGYKVTSIDDYFGSDYMTKAAFYGNNTLKSIIIEADITDIYDGSFCNCENLEKVELPDSLSNISDRVFSGCTKLSSINLPKNLESVGNRFAWNTKWLTKKEEKEKLVVICGKLISGRKASGKVEVPSSVKAIGDYAFSENSMMTELVIPGTCKSIGDSAITHCSKLKKITLKNGVKNLSKRVVIDDCPSVEKIVLPPSLTSLNAGYMFWSNNNHATYYYYRGTGAEKAFKNSIKYIKTIKGSVLPGKTKSLKTAAQKKKIKVTWKSVSTASGYQVQIATDKKFKTARTATISGKSNTSRTLVNLKSGRKYYIRQRSYRIVGGKKYYGNYTKTRLVKAK